MLDPLSEAGSSYIPTKPPAKGKGAGDQVENRAAHSWIIFVYQARIADLLRNITVTWCENLVNHYISFTVENPSDDQHRCTCRIDLKVSQFWNKKGLKNFEVDGKRVFIYWDFRHAKFSGSPAPRSDYYIALVCEEEVVLLLGDLQKDAYKRIKKRPSSPGATLLCKQENMHGKRLFCTRALLDEGNEEHHIMIESSLFGPGDPEMWISIDGIATIRILNLHWRFRGNETIYINNTSVKIFWDIHDWLFSDSNPSCGLFIFNPKTLGHAPTDECDETNRFEDVEKYDLFQENYSISGFCHILYAWRNE